MRTALPGRHKQSGQIMPVALLGVLITSAVLVLLFNTSQKITHKSQLTNAADAAAYSGAVWTARHLNFVAYTNRAMIANHVAVGHYVSYVSWVRYVHDSIDYIDRVTQWIPIVGQYVDIAEQIAEQVRELAEQSAEVVVPAIDLWNANFRAAQAEAQASLALDNLNELMQATARSYDPEFRVNDRGALSSMPHELRTIIEAQLMQQLAEVPSFVRRYTASNDRGNLGELIDASLQANADLERWIPGQRGWQETGILFRLRKQGSTDHVQSANGADWRASDQLQYRTRRLFGWSRWRRIGDRTSTATASEFDSDYSGVPSYYNVAGSPADRSLRIAAVVTQAQDRIATADLLGMQSPRLPMTAVAIARVEFRRPTTSGFPGLANDAHELANLFNPFWEARLAPVTLGNGL
jgi:hypothetical protein